MDVVKVKTANTALDALRLLIPMQDAADVLSISRMEVYRVIARGDLESVTIGRRRLIPMESLRAYVEKLRAEAAAGRAA